MEKLKFVFNEGRVKEAGRTVETIIAPIREYLFPYGVKETSKYEFVIDGANADNIFIALIVKLTRNDYRFIDLLDSWILESDYESEDVIKETKEWYMENGIAYQN